MKRALARAYSYLGFVVLPSIVQSLTGIAFSSTNELITALMMAWALDALWEKGK